MLLFFCAMQALLLGHAAAYRPGPPRAIDSTIFKVYDNTHYKDSRIGDGALDINIISAGSNHRIPPLPSEQEWKSRVQASHKYKGAPFVLDCEQIYLDTNNATKADEYLSMMMQLQTWLAQVVGGDVLLGWYGLDGHTRTALQGHYRRLIANYTNQAFFPSAYRLMTDTTAKWIERLTDDIQAAQAIDSTLPIYPYISPQLHGNATDHYPRFMPLDEWTCGMETIQKIANGFVVWSSSIYAVDTAGEPWLTATREFIQNLQPVRGHEE